jgi:hypothetical protein
VCVCVCVCVVSFCLRGVKCDIPFEVKTILNNIDGVSLQDEVVMVSGDGGSGAMRMDQSYRRCQLVNTNTRLVVAWKGNRSSMPSATWPTR